jgi:hypothetical protein
MSAMVTKFSNVPVASMISNIRKAFIPTRKHQKFCVRRPFSNLFWKRGTQQIV